MDDTEAVANMVARGPIAGFSVMEDDEGEGKMPTGKRNKQRNFWRSDGALRSIILCDTALVVEFKLQNSVLNAEDDIQSHSGYFAREGGISGH